MSIFYKSLKVNLLIHQSKYLSKVFFRNYPAPVKRFYKNVHVSEADGQFEINLDKRKLKTPLGSKLLIPNEGLAVAIATEWDMQKDIIQQHSMHLSGLCNTAIDNPCKLTPMDLAESIIQFLSSDTICFRSTEPPDFALLQKDEWDPILEWFQKRFDVKIDICEDVSGNPVPEETLSLIKRHLLSYNDWCLIGINFAAENLKSLILSLAVISQIIDVEKAVALSRLETHFQIRQWGTVEWAHTVEEVQIRARVAAGALFTYLNESSSDSVYKKADKRVQTFCGTKL